MDTLTTEFEFAQGTVEQALDASERRYRELVGALPVAVYTTDAAGRVTLYNEAAAALWGRRPVPGDDKWCGSWQLYWLDGTPLPHDQCPMAMAVRENRPIRGMEAMAVRPDGSRVLFTPYPTPLRDEKGALVGAVNVLVDITARKAAEEALGVANEMLERRVAERTRELEARNAELQRARAEAEAANAAKSRFLAIMSHELRTPLNAIIGFSEIIRDQALGPDESLKYSEFAGDIYQSGKHLLALINNILDLTKVESGNLTLVTEPVKLPEIVDECRRMVARRAAEGGITLSGVLPDPCPSVMADERATRQMLVNLLSNAIKFTPFGGSVVVRVRERADAGLDLSVTDTGIGIAPEDITDVFVPFRQLDAGLDRRHGGTGLGLAIVKTLIEAHGGTVRVESEVGTGTTVTLSFPPPGT